MSLSVIETEIRRFLSSNKPEVLCIKGPWGVGKTYAWNKFLNETQSEGKLGFSTYSYVSLFGLNSLEDLRYSIFESSVKGVNILEGPNIVSFSALFAKGSDLARKARPIVDFGLAVFNRKGIGEALYKNAFLSVRNQMICLDDLERAGTGLSTRDVLGLASFLKENRKCSVVLLLNDMSLDDRGEFNKQLEKVADTTIMFDLTPQEAVEIALPEDRLSGSDIRLRFIELNITNIRVIKKIERLAIKLIKMLDGFDTETVSSAVTTLVLSSWSVQQPDVAPPLYFIRDYNRMAIAMRKNEELDAETMRWRKLVEDYPYSSTDDLDEVVIKGAVSGYFDAQRLKTAAEKVQSQRRLTSRDNAFSKAWDELYHGSLAGDDSEFLDALHKSAISDAKVISPLNINSAIRLLRENSRPADADDVIEKYILARDDEPPEFFNIDSHHFSSEDALDEGLKHAFATRRKTYVDQRDPLTVLRSMGQRRNWTEADVRLISQQSVDVLEKMFEALRGDDLRPSIEVLFMIGRARLDQSDIILASVTEALQRIAVKSPLRARKVARFGIELPERKTQRRRK